MPSVAHLQPRGRNVPPVVIISDNRTHMTNQLWGLELDLAPEAVARVEGTDSIDQVRSYKVQKAREIRRIEPGRN